MHNILITIQYFNFNGVVAVYGVLTLCNLPFTIDKAVCWCSMCLVAYNDAP